MEHQFWHDRWVNNEIAFHVKDVNPLLLAYFNQLNLQPKNRIFLPLCGKTDDIQWLLQQGHRIVGVELSRVAIEQLFSNLQIIPKIVHSDSFTLFKADHIEIFVGDLFELRQIELGHINAVYDRAALVALPEKMQDAYVTHITEIAGNVPHLLISYVYQQALLNGPPFSISDERIQDLYSSRFDLSRLASVRVPGGLKGKCVADERVWLMSPKTD